MEKEIIQARSLAIGYWQGRRKQKIVQENLNFGLETGKLTCLLGPNGSGKSTLLRTLAGSQPTLNGELLLDGKPLESFSEKALSQRIGLVLTDKTYAGGLRVWELVELGRHPYSGFFGELTGEDRQIVQTALEQAGIAYQADSYLAELSDGERQKVMIAKALAQECPVILLDEPTAFLDVVSRIEVMNLLRDLTRQGKTILVSTHDIEQALGLADRLWLISKEFGLVTGETESLITAGEINRFFRRGDIVFDAGSRQFRKEP